MPKLESDGSETLSVEALLISQTASQQSWLTTASMNII
jgi:hypothetical protein